MKKLLTEDDLRYRLRQVFQALAAGEHFLLTFKGMAVAHLHPLLQPTQSVIANEAPSLRSQLSRVLSILSQEDLARVLGMTRVSFAQRLAEGALPATPGARFQALVMALDEQALSLSSVRMRAWWRQHHRELKGRSPLDHLALPWEPGDRRSALVFELIHRHYLLVQIENQRSRKTRAE